MEARRRCHKEEKRQRMVTVIAEGPALRRSQILGCDGWLSQILCGLR